MKQYDFHPTFIRFYGSIVSLVALTSTSVLAVSQDDSPKASDILDAFIVALGNRMHIESVDSAQITLTQPRDKMYYAYQNKKFFWAKIEKGSKRNYWGFDGKTWRQGSQILTIEKNQRTIWLIQYMYFSPPDAIRFRELIDGLDCRVYKQKIGDKHVWNVVVVAEENFSIELSFDIETNLLVRRTANTHGRIQTTDYGFREVDGIHILHTWKSRLPESDRTMFDYTTESASFDVAIDPTTFEWMDNK